MEIIKKNSNLIFLISILISFVLYVSEIFLKLMVALKSNAVLDELPTLLATITILVALILGVVYFLKKREVSFGILISYFLFTLVNIISYSMFFLSNDSLGGILIIILSIPFSIFLIFLTIYKLIVNN